MSEQRKAYIVGDYASSIVRSMIQDLNHLGYKVTTYTDVEAARKAPEAELVVSNNGAFPGSISPDELRERARQVTKPSSLSF